MGTLSNKVVQGISGEGLAEHVRTSRLAMFLLESEANSLRRGIHFYREQLESWRRDLPHWLLKRCFHC